MADNLNLVKLLEENQEKYRRLLDNVGSTYVIYSHTVDGEITFISKGVAEIFGISEADAIGKSWNQIVNWSHGTVFKTKSAINRLVLGQDQHIDHEMCFIDTDGTEHVISTSFHTETDDNGKVIAIDAICEDITEQHILMEKLRLANSIIENAHDGIVITDKDYQIIDFNPATIKLTGYTKEELLGSDPSILNSEKDKADYITEMKQALSESGYWEGEVSNRKKTGEQYTARLSVNAIKDDEDEAKNYVYDFHDISYLKERETELTNIAFSDALTGLPNRLVLNDRLGQALLHFDRHAHELAVCYIDLLDFKHINETFGHETGDQVLIEVAKRIRETVRSNDSAARVGGDEFVLLLQNIGSIADVQETVERILNDITSAPFTTPFADINIAVNMGVALATQDIDTSALLQNAESAVLHAKEAGKNNYQIFSEQHGDTALRILVVDDSKDYRVLASSMLRTVYPDAVVDLHDPTIWDIDTPEINWTDYDIMLLDYQLGDDDGIDWYNERKSKEGFPATILMSGAEVKEDIINKAVESGMAAFLQKRTTTTKELREAVDNARESYFSVDSTPRNPPTIDENLHKKSKFGGYQLKGKLGKGATASAFLAKDADGNDVAIKILEIKKDDPIANLQRFIEENRLLKKINHPNVIKIIDFGGDDTSAYTILEYMPGGTFQERLGQGISCRAAIQYTTEIAQGLQSLHAAGIIHRDLKPYNILFRKDETLVITDLGAAKAADRQDNLTKAGDAIGTPLYISPEQILNKKLDPRSDIYSLGILLYEMVAGAHPYEGYKKDVMGLLYRHAYTEIDPIPDVSDRLNEIIKLMIAKNPNERYQNVGALLQDLQDADALCSDGK